MDPMGNRFSSLAVADRTQVERTSSRASVFRTDSMASLDPLSPEGLAQQINMLAQEVTTLRAQIQAIRATVDGHLGLLNGQITNSILTKDNALEKLDRASKDNSEQVNKLNQMIGQQGEILKLMVGMTVEIAKQVGLDIQFGPSPHGQAPASPSSE